MARHPEPDGEPQPARLSADQIASALRALDGWSSRGAEAIEKRYRFESFRVAFAWMSLVAREADELDHHPEWRNVYALVEVTLTTHDAGGVTELDLELARRMDALEHAARRPPAQGR